MTLGSVAVLVALVNLPFGYWRANSEKFSRQWFLAVHLPVPLVIGLRLASGLGFQLATFPVMIGAFFLGQLMGGQLHGLLKKHTGLRVTACLVWDIVIGLANMR
ncbi:MAG TPA: hypothetical protein VF903_07420 [Nitrospirota bacterium]